MFKLNINNILDNEGLNKLNEVYNAKIAFENVLLNDLLDYVNGNKEFSFVSVYK